MPAARPTGSRSPPLLAALAPDVPPDLLVYTSSVRLRGGITELDPGAVARAIGVTALAAVHIAQDAARRMLPPAHGAMLLTGPRRG